MKTYKIIFTHNNTFVMSEGETPAEAFAKKYPTLNLKPVKKGEAALHIILCGGARKSEGYYICEQKTRRPTKCPKPVAKPKAKPVAGKHYICALYDTDSRNICGVILGSTTSFEKVQSIVKRVRAGHCCEWDRLEASLPDDCELIGLSSSSKTTLEW